MRSASGRQDKHSLAITGGCKGSEAAPGALSTTATRRTDLCARGYRLTWRTKSSKLLHVARCAQAWLSCAMTGRRASRQRCLILSGRVVLERRLALERQAARWSCARRRAGLNKRKTVATQAYTWQVKRRAAESVEGRSSVSEASIHGVIHRPSSNRTSACPIESSRP